MMPAVPEPAGPLGPELVQRIGCGDRQALADLYDQTSHRIYGLVLRIVGDPSAAEQITLDVYMRAWRTASTYKADRGSVYGWLAEAARTLALDGVRSRQANPIRDGRDAGPYLEVE